MCDTGDTCPGDAANDQDGDGVCDAVDDCLGGNNNIDQDSDGIPNFCDGCSDDPDNDAGERRSTLFASPLDAESSRYSQTRMDRALEMIRVRKQTTVTPTEMACVTTRTCVQDRMIRWIKTEMVFQMGATNAMISTTRSTMIAVSSA